jgi:exopolyphosphatase/guanosine-5'-triphosphate,3'-diphosphate pyrophosphatase
MMQKSVAEYDSDEIEGTDLDKDYISQWIEKLADLSKDERINVVGLPASRRDIIIPGLCLVEALMQYWNIDKIMASTWGLRHGLLLEHLQAAQ